MQPCLLNYFFLESMNVLYLRCVSECFRTSFMILNEVHLWSRLLSVTHAGITWGLEPSLQLKGCILANLLPVARRVSYVGIFLLIYLRIGNCKHVAKPSIFLIFCIITAIHSHFRFLLLWLPSLAFGLGNSLSTSNTRTWGKVYEARKPLSRHTTRTHCTRTLCAL